MYITKSGTTQKIDEDAWPLWRAQGWAIDEDRDGTADSLSGGGDTTGLLPIADPTGVTTGTTPNTIKGSGTYEWVEFPADAPVMAWGLAGDSFPRVIFAADPTDYGMLALGDGTYDPLQLGISIYLQATGFPSGRPGVYTPRLLVQDLLFVANGGPVIPDDADGHTYRIGSHNGALTLTQVT